ncbi:MAG: NAD(+) synthase [Patescibacteria group bacterium]
MKIHNSSDNLQLGPQLSDELNFYRSVRKFDPESYLAIKTQVITEYFQKFGLKSVVVGVSGGIDSAVALAIFKNVLETTGAIQKIQPLVLPYSKLTKGVSGQFEAKNKALIVCENLGLEPVIADMTEAHNVINNMVKGGNEWTSGQLVTNLRTPVFYHFASLLSDAGYPCLVSGTTNLDEGAYIGFFAKIGDASVDIQPISDLHKSEIYQLAKFLGLPQSIIDQEPKGDVFDGRTDAQMIGTDYDFVELDFWLRSRSEHYNKCLFKTWDKDTILQFNELRSRIENIHNLNRHKYIKGSNAIHFDVMHSSIVGGWQNEKKLELGAPFFPAPSSSVVAKPFAKLPVHSFQIPDMIQGKLIQFALSDNTVANLIRHFESVDLIQTGIHGGFYSETDNQGSTRSKSYDVGLAQFLFEKYLLSGPELFRFIDQKWSEVMGIKSGYYRAVGINPYFRYLKYSKGQYLLPHYDSETKFGPDHVTLDSMIVYLSSVHKGGATRFINDPNIGSSPLEWDWSDWKSVDESVEVDEKYDSRSGNLLVFPHRVLHDGEAVEMSKCFKRVIRTDVIYRYLGAI